MPAREWRGSVSPLENGGYALSVVPNTPAHEAWRAAFAVVPNRFVSMLREYKANSPEIAAYRAAAEAEREHRKAVDAARTKAKSLVGAPGDAEKVAAEVAAADALARVLESRTPGFAAETARTAHDAQVAFQCYVRDVANMLHTLVASQATALEKEAAELVGDRLARAHIAEHVALTLNDQHWRASHVAALIPELQAEAERSRSEAASAAEAAAAKARADADFGKVARRPPGNGTMRVTTRSA